MGLLLAAAHRPISPLVAVEATFVPGRQTKRSTKGRVVSVLVFVDFATAAAGVSSLEEL